MPHVDSVSSRVARGARRFDARHPGWAPMIDRSVLDIANCDLCMLGQLYGMYNKGLSVLGIDYREASAYGLIREPGILGADRTAQYAELTACWKAEIASRLAPPKSVYPVAGPPSDLDAELFATLAAGGVGSLVGV